MICGSVESPLNINHGVESTIASALLPHIIAEQMILILPIPPSVNALYGNRKGGRYKTALYRTWLRLADALLLTQKRSLVKFTGELEVHIRLPKRMRGDVSNRIKAVEDFLVSREVTGDDRHNWRVTIERSLDGLDCEVEIVGSIINSK
jgi:Holliday junction resolvase RusA-like endonuclease